MIITGIFMVILPEYRNYLIYLLLIEVFAWVYYTKPDWKQVKDENKRLIKYIILPTIIIDLLLIFKYPDFSSAGLIYLFFTAFAIIIYITPSLQEYLSGFKLPSKEGILLAFGVPIMFVILSKYNNAFSMLTPALSFSIATQIRSLIIMGIAPISEEIIFRGAILSGLMEKYKLGFTESNIIQAILFSITHILAYGIFLSSFEITLQSDITPSIRSKYLIPSIKVLE